MEKRVVLRDPEGNKIAGILSEPHPGKGRAAIICHGFTSSKDGRSSVAVSKVFEELGIATLRLDFFGHGKSGGRFEEITVSHAVDDIFSAICYLEARGYKRLALCGSSFGGLASIMAASKTDRLSVLVLKSPVSNYEEFYTGRIGREEIRKWKAKGYTHYVQDGGARFRMNYSFFEDFKRNDGYKAALRLKLPTLIVHGDQDTEVPISQSLKASKLMKDCELHVVKGADHRYSGKRCFEEMLDTIARFIQRRF
jgi:uncharacterized protein